MAVSQERAPPWGSHKDLWPSLPRRSRTRLRFRLALIGWSPHGPLFPPARALGRAPLTLFPPTLDFTAAILGPPAVRAVEVAQVGEAKVFGMQIGQRVRGP